MTIKLKLEKLLSCRRDPSCLGIVLARLNAYLLSSFQVENYFVSFGSLGFCGDDDFKQVWKDEYVMEYLLSRSLPSSDPLQMVLEYSELFPDDLEGILQLLTEYPVLMMNTTG